MLTTTCQYTAVIPGIVLWLTADKWTAECQPPLANIPDPSLVHIFGGAPFKRGTWQKSKLQLLPFYIESSTPPCLLRHKFLTRDFLGEKENRGELFRTKLYWDLKVYLNHRGTRVMQELFTFFQNKTLSSRKD
jgi:hypothetical protein